MELLCHGGFCCGIKTIHGLDVNPNTIHPAITGTFNPLNMTDGSAGTPGRDFYGLGEEAPKETYLQRLDRYIEYVKRARSHGIIEITLAESKHNYMNQLPIWGPPLEERGFKCVNSWKNSNSGNIVHVFHLNHGE